MAADEAGTHAELSICLHAAQDSAAAHGGRIVGTAGDAFLAEFPTAAAAVDAALGFQVAVFRRQEETPSTSALTFRVGVNLGEVIVDGDDIFGHGVNAAARIQALAEPNTVAVSSAVRDLLQGRADLTFQDLGQRRLKNVPDPVRVFLVRHRGAAAPLRSRRRFVLVGAGVIALLGLITTSWLAPWPRTQFVHSFVDGRIGTDAEAAEPTIAVLPLEERAAEPNAGYFSAGVTEDLIAALGRFSDLSVLSWSAVAPYRERRLGGVELAEELDVRYVVSGSIRQGEDRLRVAVQLAETSSGRLLWSETYEEPRADVFALQDRISRAIADALSVELTQLESRRAFEKPTSDLAAYDLVLRGRDLMRRVTPDDTLEARYLFERARTADPGYADAYVGLGWTFLNDAMWGWSEWPGQALGHAEDHARTAIALAPRDARAHALLANILRFQRDTDRAMDEAERAIALNPSDPMGFAIRGSLALWSGDIETAQTSLERALRLDPNPPNWVAANLAQAYYFEGRYEEAIAALAPVENSDDEDPLPHAVRAAALAQLERDAEAAAEAAEARRVMPFFDAAAYASVLENAAQREHLVAGMRAAGL